MICFALLCHHTNQFSSWNRLSPEISCMLLKQCWETQQTSLWRHVWMCHPEGAGLPVQTDWFTGTAKCYSEKNPNPRFRSMRPTIISLKNKHKTSPNWKKTSRQKDEHIVNSFLPNKSFSKLISWLNIRAVFNPCSYRHNNTTHLPTFPNQLISSLVETPGPEIYW